MTVPSDDIRGQSIIHISSDAGIVALVGTNVYPSIIPEEVQFENAIVVALITTEAGKGLAGHFHWEKSEVQFDCFARFAEDAAIIDKAVRLSLYAAVRDSRMIGSANVQGIVKASYFTSADAPKDASDRWRHRQTSSYRITYCPDVGRE